MVQADWCFLKKFGEKVKSMNQAGAATLTMVHVNTGCRVATSVLCKGAEGVAGAAPEGFTMRVATDFMKRMCLETVTLRTGSEPAAVDFANRVKAARQAVTHVTQAPWHASQSMGSGAAAIQHAEVEHRALRIAAEARYGVEITPGMMVWTWIDRHAAS